MNTIAGPLVSLMVLTVATAALAGKDRYDIGETATPFSLKTLNPAESGMTWVRLDEVVGDKAKEKKKAVILTFFATYCEPCKREMPFLEALYEAYRDRGLLIVSLSIDKEATEINVVKELAHRHGVTFPILSDRFNIVAKRYYISKLPCVYLVDAAGKVAMVNVGYSDDISKKLLGEIRTAIGEPVDAPVPEAIARHMTGSTNGAESVEVKQ
jgi:thiol-disulfide isomerase/thioredoxin